MLLQSLTQQSANLIHCFPSAFLQTPDSFFFQHSIPFLSSAAFFFSFHELICLPYLISSLNLAKHLSAEVLPNQQKLLSLWNDQ